MLALTATPWLESGLDRRRFDKGFDSWHGLFGWLWPRSLWLWRARCRPVAPTRRQRPGGPAPKVAPVGADGQPLSSLCDLLDVSDFSQVAGITATEPTAKDATMTAATCEFGPNVKLTVASSATVEAAMGAYQESLKTSWFADKVKQVRSAAWTRASTAPGRTRPRSACAG